LAHSSTSLVCDCCSREQHAKGGFARWSAGMEFPALVLLMLSSRFVRAMAACQATNLFLASDGWHCAEMSSSYSLYYKVNAAERNLYLGVHAEKHNGWTGIGLNGNGGMKGASMVTVRKVNQEWVAEDRHSLAYATPVLDEQQDVILLDAQDNNGDVVFSILMPFKSCDENDYPIRNLRQTVIWAKGSSHDFTYHGNAADVDRGAAEVNFFQASAQVVDPPDAVTLELKMPNVPIQGGPHGQSASNPYICAAFDLSQMGVLEAFADYHVTKYEPIIQEANHRYVHHMIANPCGGKPRYAVGEDPAAWYMLDCESMIDCAGANFVWAVGGGPVVFPPEAGYPLPTSSVRYIALQMHYYNPSLDAGLFDSSGLKLTLTKTLRPNNVGVFTLNGGTSNGMADPLPAGMPEVFRYLQVPSTCFDRSFPQGTDEVTVLGAFHHLHEKGTKMEIQLIRDGTNMGSMRLEKFYDFQHQSFAEAEFSTLRRTDNLLVRCRYDTSSESVPVSFGDLTQQEMCYGGMYYYPAVPGLTARVQKSSNPQQHRTRCRGGTVLSAPFEPNPMPCIPEGTLNVTTSLISGSTSSSAASMTSTEESLLGGAHYRSSHFSRLCCVFLGVLPLMRVGH